MMNLIDENKGKDIYSLYEEEHNKVLQLETELKITQSQAKTYARELSNVYQNSKYKRKQLAQTNDQLVKYASDLRRAISNLKQSHRDLQEAYEDTVFRLVRASEYKDKDTGSHIARISRYSTLLATKLGLSNNEIEIIGLASPMHDVGKIGIPDSIILKKGMLTDTEFNIVKSHTTIGAVILENSKASILQHAHTIALSHHEHWNGSGYPYGLSKNEIPLMARIVSLTDTFDALTSSRPYKSPYPVDIACAIISRAKGFQFDPEITDIFLNNIDEFIEIKNSISSDEQTRETSFFLSERDEVFNPDLSNDN